MGDKKLQTAFRTSRYGTCTFSLILDKRHPKANKDTSKLGTNVSLERIKISMDDRGRCKDNIWIERFWRTIKQEYVYLTLSPASSQASVKKLHSKVSCPTLRFNPLVLFLELLDFALVRCLRFKGSDGVMK